MLHVNEVQKLLGRQRRSQLMNYVLSISEDAEFVELLASLYGDSFAFFANLRQGAWYLSPALRTGGECRFKSTDGHTGHWDFSVQRLNLHVAKAAAGGGAVIVDSTKLGKRFPDSLTATVPIWCAVLNSVVFGEPSLKLPPWLPGSAAAQIEERLPGFVARLGNKGRALVRDVLSGALEKPLRCVWVHAGDGLHEDFRPAHEPRALTFTPVICASVSDQGRAEAQAAGRNRTSWAYIPGAGDDEEFWAARHGLTPSLFWRHREALVAICREQGEDALLAWLAGLAAAGGGAAADAGGGGGVALEVFGGAIKICDARWMRRSLGEGAGAAERIRGESCVFVGPEDAAPGALPGANRVAFLGGKRAHPRGYWQSAVFPGVFEAFLRFREGGGRGAFHVGTADPLDVGVVIAAALRLCCATEDGAAITDAPALERWSRRLGADAEVKERVKAAFCDVQRTVPEMRPARAHVKEINVLVSPRGAAGGASPFAGWARGRAAGAAGGAAGPNRGTPASGGTPGAPGPG